MKTSRQWRNLGLILFGSAVSLWLYTGCQEGSIYHQSFVVSAKGWDMNKRIVFSDTLPSNTPQHVHRQLTVRNTNAFPYQNLWIYIKTFTTESTQSDSINWRLANPDGMWLGKGWGSLYTITYNLPDLEFLPNDSVHWFRMELMQGLRDSLLTGISDIGLRIYSD